MGGAYSMRERYALTPEALRSAAGEEFLLAVERDEAKFRDGSRFHRHSRTASQVCSGVGVSR